MKRKAWLLRQLVFEFKICKNSDIIIIISVNENMQIFNESTAKKVNSIKYYYPTRVDAHMDIVFICFL